MEQNNEPHLLEMDKRLNEIEDKVDIVTTEMVDIARKLSLVYDSLVGSGIGKDGGVVRRVEILEAKSETQGKFIQELKWMKSAIMVLGAAAFALLGYLINWWLSKK